MERREQENPMRRKEGGEKFTAFFFVAVALFALGCLTLGHALRQRDTLIRFVPADAVVYMHANGAEATRLAVALDAPSTDAGEVATYAVVRNGSLSWSVLVRGTTPKIPDRSLAEDIVVRQGLASARSISAFQAYVHPDASMTSSNGEPLPGLPAIIVAANRRAGGYVAIIMDASVAAEQRLGFRLPAAADGGGNDAHVLPGASVIFGAVLPFTPFDIIFPPVGEYRPSTPLLTSETALRNLIEKTEVTLSVDQDTALHFNGLDTPQLASAIERYVAAAWPSVKPLVMPDGDVGREFLINPATVGFRKTDGGWQELVLQDGRYLSLASSNAGSILLIGTAAADAAVLTSDGYPEDCPQIGGGHFIRLEESTKFSQMLPFGSGISAYFEGKGLMIHEHGDKMVLICGYTP